MPKPALAAELRLPASMASDGSPVQDALPLDVAELCRQLELFLEPITLLNAQGQILDANSAAGSLFGCSKLALVGLPVESLFSPGYRAAHASLRQRFLANPYSPGQRDSFLASALHALCGEFAVEVRLAFVETSLGPLILHQSQRLDEEILSAEVRSQIAFERVLADITFKFVSISSDRFDGEVTSVLRTLCDTFHMDRASLSKLDKSTGEMITAHSWARPGIPLVPPTENRLRYPWLLDCILRGEYRYVSSPQELPPDASVERQRMLEFRQQSLLAVPLLVAGEVVGAISIDKFFSPTLLTPLFISRFLQVARIFASVVARERTDGELHAAARQIHELKDRLEKENSYLREEIKSDRSHLGVVGNSAAMRTVLRKATQVAPTDTAALLLGETGTGKELFARTIHELSRRRDHPMVKINCASLPSTLIESELFGREKGAFTGALSREIGRFELAHHSTIFLDEIGELPMELQAKLLRVLQEGEFERLGSSRTIRVDVRVIAATNRDLDAMVQAGKFREDLYYRLNVFPIHIPALRERREDIPPLVWHILRDLGKRMGKSVESIDSSTLEAFAEYPWPGNVRELRNVIERHMILHSGSVFHAELPTADQTPSSASVRLEDVERSHITGILHKTRWRIRGKGGAAELLGLKPTTLEARIQKLGLHRPA